MDTYNVADLFQGLTPAQAKQFRRLLIPALLALRELVIEKDQEGRAKAATRRTRNRDQVKDAGPVPATG